MDLEGTGPPCKTVAYADDVTILVLSREEMKWVMSEVDSYSAASGSAINRSKCESLWLGRGEPSFAFPDTLPEPQQSAKILGIQFGPGDYPLQNWEGRLKDVAQKVGHWKGWTLTLRERVHLAKAFLLPLVIYLGSVCALRESCWTKICCLFFQLLWGNRLNLVKREVTYRTRRLGGLGMVNPVVFIVNTFIKSNLTNLFSERTPSWVASCQGWFWSFFQEWKDGRRVKVLRTAHGYLPAYVPLVLRVIRRWGLEYEEIRTQLRHSLDERVLLTYFQKPLALKDCPGGILREGLKLLNSARIPQKFWDLTWRCLQGKLYVRENLKYRNSNERGCPRDKCGDMLESMEHFLLQFPFNTRVCKMVGTSTGWLRLPDLSYAKWAYGAFKHLEGRDRQSLFLVSTVVRFHL
ncbi:uncharacterized protein RB166_018321 [Leptodactylus fuscus]